MRFALGLLAIMASGPFLFPKHTAPIGSFWNEWIAAACGLGAVTLGLLLPERKPTSIDVPLPWPVLVPTLLVSGVVLQFGLGMLPFQQVALLYAAYLIWASLLIVLGRKLADDFGLARLVDTLATAIAIAALVGSAAAVIQWLGIADRVIGVYVSRAGEANVGQSNHHAHYSWLGVASAFYLQGKERLSRTWMWIITLAMIFGSVISGSRSIFVYPVVLILALYLARRDDKEGPASRLLFDAVLLLPLIIAINLFLAWATPRVPEFMAWLGQSWPWLGLDPRDSSIESIAIPGERIYAEYPGPSIKLASVRAAWHAFLEAPWLGQGVGSFPWASFWAAARRDVDEYMIIAEHAHNIEFQLLAEFGAPITVAALLVVVVWIARFVRQPWRIEHAWCGTVLGIGFVHSQVEYPLWYAHMLGITALLLGATSTGACLVLRGKRIALYLLLVAVAGAVALANLRTDYLRFERVVYQPFSGHWDREKAWKITMNHVVELHKDSLLAPWAMRTIAFSAQPTRETAEDRAELCERAMRFWPHRVQIVRCAVQISLAGRTADAERLALATLRAYPDERDATVKELTEWAKEFPETEPLRAAVAARSGLGIKPE